MLYDKKMTSLKDKILGEVEQDKPVKKKKAELVGSASKKSKKKKK